MSSGSGGKPKLTKEQKEINRLTLARLTREEENLTKEEAERERILAAGRTGRTSLLTGGYRGPGSIVRTARADIRAGERAEQKTLLKTQPVENKKKPVNPEAYYYTSRGITTDLRTGEIIRDNQG